MKIKNKIYGMQLKQRLEGNLQFKDCIEKKEKGLKLMTYTFNQKKHRLTESSSKNKTKKSTYQ